MTRRHSGSAKVARGIRAIEIENELPHRPTPAFSIRASHAAVCPLPDVFSYFCLFGCAPDSVTEPVPTGVDLLSLDGSHAVCCWNASVSFKEVRRFLRMARWVYKAREIEMSTEGA